MERVFEIASLLSTPLALGGFFAAVVFYVLRQIVAKNVFPQLSAALGASILKLIIERLFMLALVAMVLGFVAYLAINIVPLPTPSVTGSKLFSVMPIQSPEEARTKLGQMSLHYTPEDFVQSAKTGDLTAVELFLKAGMDPNATTGSSPNSLGEDKGQTALMAAASKGHTKIVAALVKTGADVKQSNSIHTALSLAVSGDTSTAYGSYSTKAPTPRR